MLERLFHLSAHGTSVRQECLAGLTSFMAMCYLIFVVPGMLADAGMPHQSAVAATIWVTIIITLIMGLWARFPVGVAPGLGITAFFAYFVCGPAGYTWQTGLGAVFISGVIFLLLTVTRVRQMIIDAVPMDLKYAIVVGIGAFIAFIGMKNCGLVVADPSTFVALGKLSSAPALLAAGGVFLIGALMARNVPGAMVLGILVITVLGLALGVSELPEGSLVSSSLPLPTETFLQMDIRGALDHGLLSIIFTLTMVDLFDNMGVLIGLARKAGFMHEDGHIDNLDRALVTDSIGTMSSALLGATTATSYLECAAGVAQGGRTGLTAVVIAALFALSLIFTPLVGVVPGYATAPVLIVVGALMMQDVVRIRFQDFTVALPAFLTILSMPLTFNIATGFGFGFISFTVLRLLTGRGREVSPVMYVVSACFAVNFVLRSL
ncbi:NCS2 family permease [uncultured Desulfovibrio sp.]|uniref:NCS2 family permease n=1 Tax=uncultured Desulfovibrio sp. TaxID=167968 RepID=UPI0026071898|nr:NCS2 family permease [uncultured Desulfovibrio sp.]